jgi:phosphoribosylformylglycinamidine synthase
VVAGGRLRVLDAPGGSVLADIPAASLHEDAPLCDRPSAPPADLEARRSDSPDALPADDPAADLLDMLADTSWVWSQYDHQLFLNTVLGPGADATVLRLKHPLTGVDTERGLGLTTDGNHRWCALDPRAGTAAVVAEALLNLACVGARPLALVNCLNFGNPEHAEVMWQLSEAIDGLAEACRAFGVPVVGGNVSLYNESRGRDIDPTPIVGVLGIVDRLRVRPSGPALVDGGALMLLGRPSGALAGSRWAWDRGHRGGAFPAVDLPGHLALCAVLRDLVNQGVALGAHDVADGGLALAVAEMVVHSGRGVRIDGIPDHAHLFSEAPSRALVCVAADRVAEVGAMAERAGVASMALGPVGGDRLVIEGLVELTVAEATAAWCDRLPVALGQGTLQA